MVTDNMTAAAGPGAAAVGHEAATTCRKSATWPLGLDPDKCKVAEIHEQIRRRCERAVLSCVLSFEYIYFAAHAAVTDDILTFLQ